MSANALPPELPALAPALAARFASLVVGLVAVIARAFYRNPIRFGAILPLCTWLQRNVTRFTRVMHKLASGTLRPRRPSPNRKSSGKPPPAFPRKRDWLLVDLKHEGAYYALRLEALLAEPQVARLIAATPQAQRLLRPLCHILGVRHASLGVRHASLGIKPKAQNLPPPRAGEGRGPSRSDGKGEGAAAGTTRKARPRLPSPLPLREGMGEGWQPHEPTAGPQPDPYATLCPRLRTRWPFNQLPQFRQS